MAERSLKSWNGFPLIVDRDFPLIVDSRTEPTPTSSDSTIGHRKASRQAGEGHHRPWVLAPVDETAGPRSCDWRIGATAAAILLTNPGQPRYHHAIHPTEKPVALLEILIRTSCPKSGLVGDCCVGSGGVGEAYRLTGRRYVGCELYPAMAERAKARLAALLRFDSGRAP